jgi:hypothetical protein
MRAGDRTVIALTRHRLTAGLRRGIEESKNRSFDGSLRKYASILLFFDSLRAARAAGFVEPG